jgi:hypothetical protein
VFGLYCIEYKINLVFHKQIIEINLLCHVKSYVMSRLLILLNLIYFNAVVVKLSEGDHAQ